MTPELRASCELVFQEHKLAASPITWNKHVFRDKISIGLCDLAKETLVKKNIIYFPKPAKKTITILNPEVAGASTFEEAIAMAQSKSSATQGEPAKEKTLYDEIYSPEFMKYADPEHYVPVQNTTIDQTQPVARVRKERKIKLQAQPAMVVTTATEEKWWLRPVFYYVIWPLSAAIVSVLIAWMMSQAVEMAHR